MLICFISKTYSQTDPNPDRGLYVDKFFKFYIGTSTMDPNNTILGIQAKETALLEYCKANHITHLALYDVNRILSATSNTYRTQLCAFIQTAKNAPYCINTIGAAGESEDFFCNLFGQPNNCNPDNPFAPISLSSQVHSIVGNYSTVLLQALTNGTIQQSDPIYQYAQFMRYVFSALGTPFICSEQFDFMTIELEFWNAGSGATFSNQFKEVIDDMNWIKQNIFPAKIELYIGRMTENYNNSNWYNPYTITAFIDGYSNSGSCPLPSESRKVDRVLAHCYTYDPSNTYYYSQNKELQISQIYGGGGLTGATYQNDFIELHNGTEANIDLTGWSIQYSSSGGTTWQVINLPITTLSDGNYYLIQLGSSGSNGSALPTPNMVNSLNIDPANGKIALVKSATALTSGTPPITSFVDFVGYGTANHSETSPAPSGNNTTAILRSNGGCRNFENNSTDFVSATPNPRNTSIPENVCNIGWRTDYFKDPCTLDGTIIHPIFSAERLDLQGDGDFTGDWIRDDARHTMFEAERIYYQDYFSDNNGTVSENIITPGAVTWFAQSFMQNHIVNPVLFTTNSPVCASAGSGDLTFEYRGPIEQGISYTFTVSGPTPTVVTGVTPFYNGSGFALSLPNCNRVPGSYTATLDLDYGCGTYSYSLPVKVVSAPLVDILTQNSSSMCEGGRVLMQASNGTSYSWSPGGATTQQITVSTSGTYTCTVTGGNCSGTASASVTMLSNPDFNITTSCLGNNLALTITPYTTGSISWNTNQSTQSINVSTSNNYITTITQTSGCFRQHEFLISGIPITQPTVSPSGPFTYCQGQGSNQTLQLSNASGTYSGVSYSWLPDGQTTTSISPINPNSSSNYLIRVYKYGCYRESNPVVFTVNPIPSISISPSNPSICFGNSVGLNANGAASFLWSPASGLSCTTCSSPTANPTVTTTYTVIGTSIGCSSTATVTVTVNPSPTVSVSPLNPLPFCAGGSGITLTASNATSYSWLPANGLNCTTCSVVNANPSVTTTYTVVGTGANGCTNSLSSTVTVLPNPPVGITPGGTPCIGTQLCTNTGFSSYSWLPNHETTSCIPTTAPASNYSVTVTNANGCTSSASASLTLSCCGGGTVLNQAYFNSHPIITPGLYNLNGFVTLTQNTVLDNCQITAATGVSISTGIFTLTLQNGSTISSCGNMWRGIIVNSGGNFISLPSINTCKIYDAQYAVDVRNNGTINIDKCEFINDYIGVNMMDISITGPIQINGYIKNSSFITTGSLKAGNPSGIPYFQYTHSFAGIRAYNVSLFNIGIGDGASVNQFIDLNFGIHSTNSNLGVRDYRFRRIKKYDSPPNISLLALKTYGSAAYTTGNPITNYLTMNGRVIITDPDFQECHFAVNSLNSNIDIKGNRIDNCDFGINVSQGNSLSIKVNSNFIDCNTSGISLNVIDRFSHSEIKSNLISGGIRQTTLDGIPSTATGIYIGGFNLNNTVTLINQNTIHLYQYGLKGIELNAIKKSIVNFNYVTLHNDINNTMKGISLTGSQENNISCNSVNGTNPIPINYSNDEAAYDIFDSQSNDIKCNGATKTSIGYRFSGTCQGGVVPTTFRSNDIQEHYNGLVYTYSALVDPQINQGNWWYFNTYPGHAATNLNPSQAIVANEKYEVYANLSTGLNMPTSIFVTAAIQWFYPVLSNDANCGNIGSHRSDCNTIVVPPPTGGGGGIKPIDINPVDESVALGESNSSSYNEETQWKEQVTLYEKLLKMPDYKDEHPVLTDFFENQEGTTVEQVATINVENDVVTLTQETLLQTIENNSASIYQKADTIRACDSTLSAEGLDEAEIMEVSQIRSTAVNQLNQLITSNNQQFSTLENIISDNTDQLNIQNEDISSSEVYEQNEQVINDVYLNGIVAKNSEYFNGNTSSIYAIAQQCPLSGGPAVFRARSLYKIIDPNIHYNDDLACQQSGRQLRLASKNQFPVGVFPNPASTEVTITYAINSDQLLQIVDGLGRICMEVLLNPKENRVTKNISQLTDGIYSLRLTGKDNIQKSMGRLTILK